MMIIPSALFTFKPLSFTIKSMNYLMVCLGGMLGATLRYVSYSLLSSTTTFWPWATITVNALGCLLAGSLLGLIDLHKWPSHSWWLTFLATGVLGSFTTFSTFILDNFQFIRKGHYIAAISNTVLQIVLGLVLVIFGHWLILTLSKN